jgi:hypothetical protein
MAYGVKAFKEHDRRNPNRSSVEELFNDDRRMFPWLEQSRAGNRVVASVVDCTFYSLHCALYIAHASHEWFYR